MLSIAIIRDLEYNLFIVVVYGVVKWTIFLLVKLLKNGVYSKKRVAILCAESRIKNAQMIGNAWVIPSSAEKTIDARS